ncbi:response regulator [Sphingomonas solaris]|uniref:Response regulator n=1 Tax=Alterirhizorhabdus solaris TaxID=2529389 RepID=A0A558QSJ8_9SPHN|nr:response regulator [Sphingomonas solaris]TVV70109.1 response regulator [Sphingomonas solaris]
MNSPLSVLIVEDEPLISMMLEDFVETLGHTVAGTADCVSDALKLVEAGGVDIVILDVRLRGGEASWPVADRLADRGIAYLISTGGHVDPPPARHAAATQLAKPFTMDGISKAIETATARV